MDKQNLIGRWLSSANNAIEGVIHAAKTQRHLKFHLFIAFFTLLFCFLIGVAKNDFIIITIVTMLVIATEMLNTAIEQVVDMVCCDWSEPARIAKDVAAGAVLVMALGAVIVGYLVLWPYFQTIFREGFHLHRQHFSENITILAVIVNLLLIVLLKSRTGDGLPLRGGFPSGHAALSFSIFVSLTYLTDRTPIILAGLAFTLAVSITRRLNRIHTWIEIGTGALIGSGVTWLLFLIFRHPH